MSGEIDILPIAESNEETAQLADRIEGVAGELLSAGLADPGVITARLSTVPERYMPSAARGRMA